MQTGRIFFYFEAEVEIIRKKEEQSANTPFASPISKQAERSKNKKWSLNRERCKIGIKKIREKNK